MAGWSISGAPKAERCRTCQAASATACRIPAALPRMQSSRVRFTISRMVRTPRPSSPRRHPTVPSNSISLEAFDRLPSLSLSRWMANGLRLPSSRMRGTRKQLRPASVCASTRNASDIGAEQNHLWPVSRYRPSPAGTARVVLARTIRSALLLGHRHAEQRGRLARPELRVVVPGEKPRQPHPAELVRGGQGGDGRVRHRHRAGMTGLDLREQHEGRRTRDVRPRPRMRPRRGVRSRPHRLAEDAVIGRVVLHLVDAVAPPVEGAELRLVDVGALRIPLEPIAADEQAGRGELGARPSGIVPLDRFAEREVRRELVDADARRRLVGHAVGAHAGPPSVRRTGATLPAAGPLDQVSSCSERSSQRVSSSAISSSSARSSPERTPMPE